MSGGRPSSFTSAVADFICERLSEGISLREICRAEDMPSKTTVMRWLADKPEFRDHYAIAREAQAEHMADEILEIADNAVNDWMLRKQGEDTVEVVNHDHIARSRLMVDARKWLLSKMLPKKYGDKITHAGDAENPIAMVPVLNVITRAPDDQLGTAPKAVNGARLNGH